MLSEEMKKIVLIGIGAVASTAECSQQLVEKLVKKGELTVEQGKVLNEELKHNIKDVFSTDSKTSSTAETESDLLEKARQLNPEQRAELQRKLAEMESSIESEE